MAHIFVSYSRTDEDFARKLAEALSELGADIWIDVDDIPVGLNWSTAIQEGLDRSELMILIISPESMASTQVAKEWQFYLDEAKPILPVVLRSAHIHYQINPLQRIDFEKTDFPRAFIRLQTALKRNGVVLKNSGNIPDTLEQTRPDPMALTPPPPVQAAPPPNRTPLIIGVIVAVIVILGAAVALLGSAANRPTPTATEAVALAATSTATPTSVATAVVTNSATPTVPPTLEAGAPRTDGRGVEQVLVQQGCFLMGSDPNVDKSSIGYEIPQHDVCLTKDYWIDKTEVTNAEYQRFIDDGGYTTRDYWSEAGWAWLQSQSPKAPQNYAGTTEPQQPRVGVSWYEAEAYAKWRGGRLPTEAEWEYAARGPNATIYPWGDIWDSSKANASTSGPTSPVGSYEGGVSWVGAYDMAGNAWEWTKDWFGATYYQQKVQDDPTGPTSGDLGNRTLRGGSWAYRPSFARSAFRNQKPPATRTNDIGFRVASSEAF
ncbi:MAG: SUMF1/EgtB/PvdO family nonheme iron enzyme [Chloroflexota bacterium]